MPLKVHLIHSLYYLDKTCLSICYWLRLLIQGLLHAQYFPLLTVSFTQTGLTTLSGFAYSFVRFLCLTCLALVFRLFMRVFIDSLLSSMILFMTLKYLPSCSAFRYCGVLFYDKFIH